MKKNDFYGKFLDFMEIECTDNVGENTILRDLDEYDSFFVLTMVAFIDDNFSVNLTSKQLTELETVGDLMSLIGNEKFVD